MRETTLQEVPLNGAPFVSQMLARSGPQWCDLSLKRDQRPLLFDDHETVIPEAASNWLAGNWMEFGEQFI